MTGLLELVGLFVAVPCLIAQWGDRHRAPEIGDLSGAQRREIERVEGWREENRG